jgi:NhaP-type Na+/H+ or K+/H+ antiporter
MAASQVIKRIDDAMIEITMTTIAAYGSFVCAEHFHFSGVIAVVVAGVPCGNYGARFGMTPSTRVAGETFWEFVAFALNSFVFLLIGLEVHLDALVTSWKAILVACLVVITGRGSVIFAVSAWLRKTREKIPWPWSVVLTWGGLRGGLPMVLVLSLAKDFPHRDLLVTSMPSGKAFSTMRFTRSCCRTSMPVCCGWNRAKRKKQPKRSPLPRTAIESDGIGSNMTIRLHRFPTPPFRLYKNKIS